METQHRLEELRPAQTIYRFTEAEIVQALRDYVQRRHKIKVPDGRGKVSSELDSPFKMYLIVRHKSEIKENGGDT